MPKQNDADYLIGYGKPPKRTQFKPGQSGNPHGRPKKVTTFDDDVQQELKSQVAIKEGGKRKKIRRQRAIAKQLVIKAMAGHVGSARLVVGSGRKQKEDSGDNLPALLQEFRAKNAQNLTEKHVPSDREGDDTDGQDN